MVVKKTESEAFKSMQTSTSALLEIGAIDKATMRKLDESCIAEDDEALVAKARDRLANPQRITVAWKDL